MLAPDPFSGGNKAWRMIENISQILSWSIGSELLSVQQRNSAINEPYCNFCYPEKQELRKDLTMILLNKGSLTYGHEAHA
jgi:hypothetical protein